MTGAQARLLTDCAPLVAHIRRHGPLPTCEGPTVVRVVELSGLVGRGGPTLPTGRRLRAIARAAAGGPRSARRPGSVVIADGRSEHGVDGKDSALLTKAPHLVLDGITLAARAVGAPHAYLLVHRADLHGVYAAQRALIERHRARYSDAHIEVILTVCPDPPAADCPHASRVGRSPVAQLVKQVHPTAPDITGHASLIDTIETFANIALIARRGPHWFRSVGSPATPGTVLVTVSGAVAVPGVYEIALSTTGAELLMLAGGPTADLQAVLAGGSRGAWLSPTRFAAARISGPGLRAAGAAMGDADFFALPAASCGLVETSRITSALAARSEGRCGPCFYGLAAFAAPARALAAATDSSAAEQLWHVVRQATGEAGGIRHAGGPAAMVASALTLFASDVTEHLNGRRCSEVNLCRAPR